MTTSSKGFNVHKAWIAGVALILAAIGYNVYSGIDLPLIILLSVACVALFAAHLSDKAEKEKAEAAISELQSVLEGDDLEAIKSKTEELMQASMAIGEMAYRKSQEDAAGEPEMAQESDSSETSETADDNVVDAEVVDDDEESQKSA